MNILFWSLQVVLALLFLSGGAYKAFSFQQLAGQFSEVPHAGWRALGLLEMAGGVLLIIPAALKWMPGLTAHAAAVLAFETFALAALYARHSTKLTPENPMLWALVMGGLVAFVAYGRYVLHPVVPVTA
ncbi:DoxX family protein [Corallococcus macrosporus]|uniref:DoxX family protein n=1 Tax=Corallococcus macrosporus TaxID=35 RepID=A0ABS3D9L7_9BACT|nr:DoxX family protein [Corallococcus macrosporus]MBN8228363.1 DoxX family protein [Corallococcus macrosporus]